MPGAAFTVDPLRSIEIKGQSYPLLPGGVSSVPANNVLVVAAVTGKRIRVMYYIAQTIVGVAGPGNFRFKSASGGTFLTFPEYAIQPEVGAPIVHETQVQTGYFETNTGEGLYVDIAGQQVIINLDYIVYTP